MGKLKAQRVLVMGASGNIGQAVAKELASQGIDLILVGRSSKKLEEVAAACESHGSHCLLVPAAFNTLVQLDELAVHVAVQYGALDGLISCLGYVGSLGPLHTVAEKEWMLTWMVNVHLNWKALQSFYALLSKGKPGAALFPLESHWLSEHPYACAYGLAKKALATLVQQFTLDNQYSTVRAHVVALPFANTPLLDKTFPGLQGSLACPADLARTIVKQFQTFS